MNRGNRFCIMINFQISLKFWVHRLLRSVTGLLLVLLLSSCASRSNLAPVTSGWQSRHAQGTYIVQPGDTIYAIAWRYGLDYRDFARYNHIAPPYKIVVGQRLRYGNKPNKNTNLNTDTAYRKNSSASITRLTKQNTAEYTPAISFTQKQAVKVSSSAQNLARRSQNDKSATGPLHWQWPTKGKIIASFSTTPPVNKGIDIAGKMGQPVYAAATGSVVYAGSGIRGYGQLILLKNSNEYLSAYANNSVLLVKEGQFVQAGQEIAKMGNTDATRIMLHFEIRASGVPVNPLQFLPATE